MRGEKFNIRFQVFYVSLDFWVLFYQEKRTIEILKQQNYLVINSNTTR